MAGLDPQLSGSIFLGKAHGVDSNHFQEFGDSLGHERTNAVPHTNTVFHDVLKLLPWSTFEGLV
jgi:hypothetical protein